MNEEDRIKVTKVEIRAVDETGKDTARARENIGFSGFSTGRWGGTISASTVPTADSKPEDEYKSDRGKAKTEERSTVFLI